MWERKIKMKGAQIKDLYIHFIWAVSQL